jgi:hypothetical protein
MYILYPLRHDITLEGYMLLYNAALSSLYDACQLAVLAGLQLGAL